MTRIDIAVGVMWGMMMFRVINDIVTAVVNWLGGWDDETD